MRDPITIITTVRDGDAFLDGYFENLAQILGSRDHVVMVDDGSIVPLAKPLNWQCGPKLTLLHPGKIGRGKALNLAIENSPTDLIAIQDIDDLSMPDRLDLQVRQISNDHNRLIFSRALSDPCRPVFGKLKHFSPSRLYMSNPLHHSSLVMHRSVWARAGGYATDLPCCIDLDFYLRACVFSRANICRLHTRLINRTLDRKNRHFVRISDALYQKTRAHVFSRYQSDLPWSIWQVIAKLQSVMLFSGKDVR